MSVHAELNVDGIGSGESRSVVEKSLTALDGVEKVRIDPTAHKVVVTYDDIKIDLVDIKQTIMEKGYSVIEI